MNDNERCIPMELIVIIIIFIIGIFSILHNCQRKKETAQINETVISKFSLDDNYKEIFDIISLKDQNWELLPLSNSFLYKFNPYDGVFVNDDYTQINISRYDKEKKEIVYHVAHGTRYDDYFCEYIINDDNELDDFSLIKKVVTQYDIGDYPKLKLDRENFEGYILNFAVAVGETLGGDSYNSYDSMETSEHFRMKYPNGYIIGLDNVFNRSYLSDLTELKNNTMYIKIPHGDYNSPTINYYRIKYYVDKQGSLDDVDVEEVTENYINKLLAKKGIDKKAEDY